MARLESWEYSPDGNKVFQFRGLTMSSHGCNGEFPTSKRIRSELTYLSRKIADQYKPAPGSPYRPVLSPPQQIYYLQSGWSNCIITTAFAGIDPPRPLTPAAALVPNPTPASTQSHAADTISTSLLKNQGPTRRPLAAPAHKLKTAGPRSTPNPSSSTAADFDPPAPKNSLDPQKSQVAKADSRIEDIHAPETSKIASESRTSSETAKKTRTQDPSHVGNEIHNLLNFFRFSRVSSSESSDIKSKSTPNHVTPTSLSTQGDNYEAGASLPFPSATSGARPSQNHISSNPSTLPSHGSSVQESEDPQGTSIAEPASWQLQTRSDGRISTADRKTPIHTDKGSDESSTRVVADPLTDPVSVLDPVGQPILESTTETSTHTALKSSPYNSLPTDPELSVPSSSLRSSLTDPNILNNSQTKISANIPVASRNQTAFASKLKSPSNSSSPIPAVLPYKGGAAKSVLFRPMRELISFASVYFAFFL